VNIQLRYFSGTGNSWTVLNTCKTVFEDAGNTVQLSEIDRKETTLEADLVGFAFPVYSFGMPHIIREYIQSLQPFQGKQKIFVIVTAGDVIGASSTTKKFEHLILPLNTELIYSDVIKMPNNWIPFSTTDSENNESILNEGKRKAQSIANSILASEYSSFDINRTPPFLRTVGNGINVMFRHAGRIFMKHLFSVYGTCNGCTLCAQACPTQCIKMKNGKPTWTGNCEQCMRCVNICPQKSIYQKMGGKTKGKDRYMAPGFDPMHSESAEK
jgi:ferredoxin